MTFDLLPFSKNGPLSLPNSRHSALKDFCNLREIKSIKIILNNLDKVLRSQNTQSAFIVNRIVRLLVLSTRDVQADPDQDS